MEVRNRACTSGARVSWASRVAGTGGAEGSERSVGLDQQVAILELVQQAGENFGPVRISGRQLGPGALGGGVELGHVVDQDVERSPDDSTSSCHWRTAFRPSSSTSRSR